MRATATRDAPHGGASLLRGAPNAGALSPGCAPNVVAGAATQVGGRAFVPASMRPWHHTCGAAGSARHTPTGNGRAKLVCGHGQTAAWRVDGWIAGYR